MPQQSNILMLQGSFNSEHAKGLILKLVKEKMQFEPKNIKGNIISEDYLQYNEERRATVEEELIKILDKVGDSRVTLHAIILIEPSIE